MKQSGLLHTFTTSKFGNSDSIPKLKRNTIRDTATLADVISSATQNTSSCNHKKIAARRVAPTPSYCPSKDVERFDFG
jgi:hypothetical protein